MYSQVIFIVGPTGVGKTEIALGLAQSIDGEIISADSMQVYRGLDILTAKPSLKEQKQVTHHLIDIIDADYEFDVVQYTELVKKALKKIYRKNKRPCITGGTGLYINALLDGIFVSPPIDTKIREQLKEEAGKHGTEYLYKRLKRVDIKAAEKIHQNDTRRIIRALEVYKATKNKISSCQKKRKGIINDFIMIGLNRDRKELYRRIEERVEKMFSLGVVAEIKNLVQKNILSSKTANQALGVKEIRGYINKEYNLKEAKRLLKRNTRRYAKRQLTWFKRDSRIQWFNLKKDSSKEEILKGILEII